MVQRYAAVLVPQQQDDFLPLTNQQAEQLVTQQSRSRQELLNDMGESLLSFLKLGRAQHAVSQSQHKPRARRSIAGVQAACTYYILELVKGVTLCCLSGSQL